MTHGSLPDSQSDPRLFMQFCCESQSDPREVLLPQRGGWPSRASRAAGEAMAELPVPAAPSSSQPKSLRMVALDLGGLLQL